MSGCNLDATSGNVGRFTLSLAQHSSTRAHTASVKPNVTNLESSGRRVENRDLKPAPRYPLQVQSGMVLHLSGSMTETKFSISRDLGEKEGAHEPGIQTWQRHKHPSERTFFPP